MVKKLAFTASLMLVMAFIVSCSDSEDNGKGNDIANYKTVKIGNQMWMAENLDYAVEGSKCYDCATYGRLYNWEAAMTACPSGWHLPTLEDWYILLGYALTDNGRNYTPGSIAYTAGTYLKATSGWVCSSGDISEDKYEFAALPGGYGGSEGGFYNALDHGGYWWAADEYSDFIGYGIGMYCGIDYAREDTFGKGLFYSVRCVKD
jgi:uncharacterized protein (TIGR02145 family)